MHMQNRYEKEAQNVCVKGLESAFPLVLQAWGPDLQERNPASEPSMPQ